jgi:hypothetical protein
MTLGLDLSASGRDSEAKFTPSRRQEEGNFNETAPKHLNSTDLGALPRGNLTPTMPSSTITCGE